MNIDFVLYVLKTIVVLVIVSIVASCKQDESLHDSVPYQSNDTVVFLDYGMIPPPFYDNAKEIIGHQYNVQYVRVAGCIVSQRLMDSVQEFEKKSIEKLARRKPPLAIDSLNKYIEKEYHYLQFIDSVLTKSNMIKNKGYLYYTRFNGVYSAYKFKYESTGVAINELAKIDSSNLKITVSQFLKTDTIIQDLKKLHYENN